MATGTHRKPPESDRKLPRIPVAHIVTVAALLVLTAALLAALCMATANQSGTEAWPAQVARVMAVEAQSINAS
jgi:hypothetical protein